MTNGGGEVIFAACQVPEYVLGNRIIWIDLKFLFEVLFACSTSTGDGCGLASSTLPSRACMPARQNGIEVENLTVLRRGFFPLILLFESFGIEQMNLIRKRSSAR